MQLVVEAGNVHEGAKDQVWLADLTGQHDAGGHDGADRRRARARARGDGRRADGIGVGPDRARPRHRRPGGARRRGACSSSPTSSQRPRLPEAELARVKANLARDLAIQKSTPQSVAQEQFAAADLRRPSRTAGSSRPRRCSPATRSSRCARFHRDHYGPQAGAALRRRRVRCRRRWRRACARRSTRGRAAPTTPRRAAGAARPRGFALHRSRRRAAVDRHARAARCPTRRTPDWVALEVTDSLLGGSFASRITSQHPRAEGLHLLAVQHASTTHPEDAQLGRERRRDDRT